MPVSLGAFWNTASVALWRNQGSHCDAEALKDAVSRLQRLHRYHLASAGHYNSDGIR
jgi:hypothetical protein